MSHPFCRLLVPAACAVLLLGCETDRTGTCPAVSSLVETSQATVFRPGMPMDPSNMVYTVEITGMKSSCDVDKQAENANTELDIQFRATRAPNGAEAHYKVPYYVAITQEERILAKKIYTVEFDFQPGQSTTTFSESIGSAEVTAAREKKTFDYNVLVGLQLTKAQLDYNRAIGHYGP